MEYVFALICIAISVTDVVHRRIDNLAVILLLIVVTVLSQHDSQEMIVSLIVTFLIAIIIFALHIWGGGDSKLLLALSPLFTVSQLPDLVVAVLLCGGLLSLVYWVKYHIILKAKLERGIPYGVAIVCGANLSLYFSKGLPIYS